MKRINKGKSVLRDITKDDLDSLKISTGPSVTSVQVDGDVQSDVPATASSDVPHEGNKQELTDTQDSSDKPSSIPVSALEDNNTAPEVAGQSVVTGVSDRKPHGNSASQELGLSDYHKGIHARTMRAARIQGVRTDSQIPSMERYAPPQISNPSYVFVQSPTESEDAFYSNSNILSHSGTGAYVYSPPTIYTSSPHSSPTTFYAHYPAQPISVSGAPSHFHTQSPQGYYAHHSPVSSSSFPRAFAAPQQVFYSSTHGHNPSSDIQTSPGFYNASQTYSTSSRQSAHARYISNQLHQTIPDNSASNGQHRQYGPQTVQYYEQQFSRAAPFPQSVSPTISTRSHIVGYGAPPGPPSPIIMSQGMIPVPANPMTDLIGNSQVGRRGNRPSKGKNKQSGGHTEPTESTIDSISGNMLALSEDQGGCRMLQRLMEDSKSGANVTDMIFTELFDHLGSVMMNVFGNFLFQKLYVRSSEDRRTVILKAVENIIVDACCDKHGSRSVQKIVQVSASNPYHVSVITGTLQDHTVRICIDENGNHVIQGCLDAFTPQQNRCIYEKIIEYSHCICTARYGNRVMQKCIQASLQNYCGDVTEKIVEDASSLITDQFGNYIIQYILKTCPHHTTRLCKCIVGNVTNLSVQKHSSVVIEKCFEMGSYEVRAQYVDEIIRPDNLTRLINDRYGNYVLQRALKYLPTPLVSILSNNLMDRTEEIQRTPWGLQIISKLFA
mmetsp:Transcript_12307/g.18646  ORF Transcript_12307/g.18646 Transcript_12307/m.18646 type:complete len:723 (+) Transcript_12307:149-2317(+)|eukprot:CAMPEP_0185038386 /NCGR_PEP_ID=MMETSP1103-20130426/33944_1 /TAXON_ID=36769 /ORGANISM="Paraphysomonas bandaiensis, Strain Caron Lab Isolate" /LENGTH=722 /DNA_ID=CAMNT_0027576787 /DNA_START=64 /DNA_END=2232 /DNA_ORIENTATION=+